MPSFSDIRQKGFSGPLLTFGITPARDAKAVGRANQSAVLRAARWHGPVSRRELSEITDLGSATVFSIVEELLDLGLLLEGGIGESTGGRKPTLYRFNPEAFYVIGAAVGALGQVRLVLTDLDGKVLSKVISDLPTAATPDELVQSIASTTDQAIREAGICREKIAGVGVAMYGTVDIANGVVIDDPYHVWHSLPLARLITESTGLPGYVINYSSAAALGEKWCGAGRDLDTFLCVNVGIGVGVGMILDGKLYTGANSMAGRLGHNIVDRNGPLCWCGKQGCLGAVAGGGAIMQRAIQGLRLGALSSIPDFVDGHLDKITPFTIGQAAAEGDLYAVQIIQEAGRFLGMGIAWLINILNPQAVIVAGGITAAGDVLMDAIRGAVTTQAMSELVANVQIIPASLGLDARPIGAAIVVLERQLTLQDGLPIVEC
jgi:N-acetylglucosamine repressor